MASPSAVIWQVSVHPRSETTHAEARAVRHEIHAIEHFLKLRFHAEHIHCRVAHGYLLESSLDQSAIEAVAEKLLYDPVLETLMVAPLTHSQLEPTAVTVLRRPGVMDPVADSAMEVFRARSIPILAVRQYRRYTFGPETPQSAIAFIADHVLANNAVDQIVFGNLSADHLAPGTEYRLKKITVPLRDSSPEQLDQLSKAGGLFLNATEMLAIQAYFRELQRDPTDVELETLAQTWSEHCSHKTLRGPYEYAGQRSASGLLKDTIMAATRELNRDWLLSVFEDNAGVIRFDDQWALCFKVETHNHPSALEPYGGANTGIGGVIRDPLGTGLGAKPICNTDVFCFAPPTTRLEDLPAGVLHPLRVLRGVVAGVRDYGNRMGIPTVNGAVCFDPRYLGNPLVFCGTLGLLPIDKCRKEVRPGDRIIALGGRTGRDGIHGATFSSGELTADSETASGGAVQIGNAITEKKLVDVVLQARDRGLFRAITDCGAGGFSSAVGEMGQHLGATVCLEKAPLKYSGLSYTEIWISESQERMILAVSPDKRGELFALAASEDVEATDLGEFTSTGKLMLTYEGEVVGELAMEFLHRGRPAVLRVGQPPATDPRPFAGPRLASTELEPALIKILGALDVCSKEWIIRQYDHEVQAGSIIKPLVGVAEDGPSDAAVILPVLGLWRGAAIGCGILPRYGALDPYRMAASAIDEAIRNVVAVGGDPERIALLDNFCWGNTERPEVFGSLCLSAIACRDVATSYGAPFISGKDSLYNEYQTDGRRLVIPPTLLISALAIVPDVRRCTTMDLKEAGNLLILVGTTRLELGGSVFAEVVGGTGGEVPLVDTEVGRRTFRAIHQLIQSGWVRACHDLSDGGLGVAAAEMAFAGGLGVTLDLACVPNDGVGEDEALLFAESNSRFLLEISPRVLDEVRGVLGDLPHGILGTVNPDDQFHVVGVAGESLFSASLARLKRAWKEPLALR